VSFTDKILTCRDCGEQFTWTAGEQEFYQSRGLLNPPTRCPSCRAARKSAQGGGGGGGGYSTRSSYGGDSGGYSGGGGYGARSSAPREMFDAVCSNCGKDARVPFRPTNGKPVYCSDCFRTMRGN
jgi:CxxC-x17-CxxC domain-containing protein